MAFDRKAWNKKYKEDHKEEMKEWRKERYKNKTREQFYETKYGIGLTDYNYFFEKQNGCCAICGKHQMEFEKSLSIDHNHETGSVRGLLCSHCNAMLGYANDNISTLQNAIEYLINTSGSYIRQNTL